MLVLQNDVNLAQESATSISNGVSSLESSGQVTKDGQSRLEGNEKAKSVIDASYDVSKAVSQAISQMSQNIRSVSSAFEAMDKQLGEQLEGLSQVNKVEFSLND